MSKTILITGANSGLGFDSARQFAQRGWTKVIIGARSEAKADAARQQLMGLTGLKAEVFGSAIMDMYKPETVQQAVAALAAAGTRLDGVVLNAGGLPPERDDGLPHQLPTGVTELYAMNIGGHAVLVHGLLDAGVLNEGATVMLAGSEAARGIPTMMMASPELPAGDVDAAVRAVVAGTHAGPGYDAMLDYGMVKLIGAAWMRHVSETHGVRALTVSPGFTGGTAAMDKLPLAQRVMFKYVAMPLLKLTGNAHGLEYGAKRYIQAFEDRSLEAGAFYASPKRGISGPLALQTSEHQPLLGDPAFTAAVGRLVEEQVAALSGSSVVPIARGA